MTNNSDNQAKLSLDHAKTNGHLLIKFDDNGDLFQKGALCIKYSGDDTILNILASISIVTVYLLLNVIIIKPDKSISFNTQDLNVKDGFLRIYRLFNICCKRMKKYVLFDKKKPKHLENF